MLENKILTLYAQGIPYKVIYFMLRDEYGCSRNEVRNILKRNGFLTNTKHGGYRFGSGKGTKYAYGNFVFDSYSEFVFYLYRKIINFPVKKNYKTFAFSNNVNYTPDFVDENNTFYEIKSLSSYDLWGNSLYKLQSFENLIIVQKDELERMEKLVKEKYNDSFFETYIRTGFKNF